jgi:transglutaminase-like putative cysteine protease
VLIEVVHTTRLDYSAEVVEAVVDTRLGPLSDDDQRVQRFDLQVRPAGSTRRYRDGFGNAGHLVTLVKPHAYLEITSTTEVETLLADPFQPPAYCPPLAEALSPADLAAALAPTSLIPLVDELAEMAAPFRPAGPDGAFEAVQGLTRLVYEGFAYRQYVTTVASTVLDVLRGRQGVCQDLAHLLIGLCRSLGMPARYVSGYVVPGGQVQASSSGSGRQYQSQRQTRADGRAAPRRGAGASHAWAEVHTPSHGWRGFDPTNNLVANDSYVKVAIGRDYRDVAPTRGTYRGVAVEQLSVSVATRRLA